MLTICSTRHIARTCALLFALSGALPLAACGDKATDATKAQATVQTAPNLAQATSPQAVREAQATAAREALPKADKATPDSSYITLDSGNQLMYTYLALTGMPPDYAQVANSVSKDYARAADEFRKHDLLTALTPKIDADIAAAKSHRYFKMTIPNPIGKYSFEQKGFPLDNSLWEAGAYRYFFDNGEYKLGFSNGDAFRYLGVDSEATARSIEAQRARYDAVKLTVYGYYQNADTAQKIVTAQIVKVALVDKQGNVLAAQ
ncbi:hypothetical protein [Ralstonia flatus]|uniref:Uncharacterized protein n=1 Tax=Ralstonia flatus TaxID=3058601 RepID=A0ABN9KFI7_9RALS|nr:hypothetical protein [Ralstonia sp. LMG 32965]MBN6209447.1 hypothetical protein [Ralstonia pickettii]CAJ0893333.1 hypothetical protein R77564_03703 [Ralstonia sp. LMG 32965]